MTRNRLPKARARAPRACRAIASTSKPTSETDVQTRARGHDREAGVRAGHGPIRDERRVDHGSDYESPCHRSDGGGRDLLARAIRGGADDAGRPADERATHQQAEESDS